jgi:hypothetical protein
VLEDLSELSDGHHILGVGGWPDPDGYEGTQEAQSIQEADLRLPRTQKDLDRYKELLAQWFRAALEHD